jgi:hypothetical protein
MWSLCSSPYLKTNYIIQHMYNITPKHIKQTPFYTGSDWMRLLCSSPYLKTNYITQHVYNITPKHIKQTTTLQFNLLNMITVCQLITKTTVSYNVMSSLKSHNCEQLITLVAITLSSFPSKLICVTVGAA